MARLRFPAKLSIAAWNKCGVTANDNFIVLEYPPDAKPRVRAELTRLYEFNIKRELAGKETVDLDVEINIAYSARSPEANALMWACYGVIAEMMNAEAKERKRITSQELHDEDMKDWAVRRFIRCKEGDAAFFVEILRAEKGEVHEITTDENGDKIIEVWQTTRFWNSKQMADHIDRLFTQIETMGRNKVDNGDVAKIYADFMAWKKKEDKN